MPKSSDAQTKKQALKAINQVIDAHRGIALLKIKPDLRRAFPFGPTASEEQRRIWNETVEETMAELAKWPCRVTALLLAFALCAQSAIGKPAVEKFYLIPAIKEDGTTIFFVIPKRKRWSWNLHHKQKPTKKEKVLHVE
jgi:hypothetical protein